MVVASTPAPTALRTGDADISPADVGPVDRDLADRILDGTLLLVARWGVAKTSLSDVARAAGCSRATLYRVFPGGKQHLFVALAQREIDHYLESIADAMATADDLTEAVTRGIVVATRLLRDHDAARFVLDHEPDVVVPYLAFDRINVVYRHTASTIGAHLERYLPRDRAEWLAEWLARVFITYLFNPDPEIDLSDAARARHHIETFVLPAFTAASPAPSIA